MSSFFSKKGIAAVVNEVIDHINELNADNEEYVGPDKKVIGGLLVKKGLINDSIYEAIVGKKSLGTCHALIKNGKRCSYPITKVNSNLCVLHTNNRPKSVCTDSE